MMLYWKFQASARAVFQLVEAALKLVIEMNDINLNSFDEWSGVKYMIDQR
jgi:hypothetical protein